MSAAGQRRSYRLASVSPSAGTCLTRYLLASCHRVRQNGKTGPRSRGTPNSNERCCRSAWTAHNLHERKVPARHVPGQPALHPRARMHRRRCALQIGALRGRPSSTRTVARPAHIAQLPNAQGPLQLAEWLECLFPSRAARQHLPRIRLHPGTVPAGSTARLGQLHLPGCRRGARTRDVRHSWSSFPPPTTAASPATASSPRRRTDRRRAAFRADFEGATHTDHHYEAGSASPLQLTIAPSNP